MGDDAVAMVKNSRNISLQEFIDGMEKDVWGKSYSYCYSRSEPAWIQFEWEGTPYFSMICNSPGYFRLFTKKIDLSSDSYHDNPEFDYQIQMRFLKAMRVVENLAGGPVYLGNDVISGSEPPDPSEEDPIFFIPPRLDYLIDDWRQIADTDITIEELFDGED